MKKIAGKRKVDDTAIDLTPMLDVVFILLIFLSLIHISEPTRLRRISYAVFCLKKKKKQKKQKKKKKKKKKRKKKKKKIN